VFELLQSGQASGTASVLTISEVTTRAYQIDDAELARVYELRMLAFPTLILLPVDRRIARTAARIRARYGFRLPDSIHLATALEYKADTFIFSLDSAKLGYHNRNKTDRPNSRENSHGQRLQGKR
jgi:predicted nucleic acid-binding protein